MLLEIALAITTAKALGYVFEKLKRLTVIGEILAGILLGPFLLTRVLNGTMSLPVMI
ncbi:MAG: hypothetical protein QME47_02010 [Candidatus Thermoplasmatota archaeon]|nr:hypothetical protein [Candidatus Thermoplasmatota archaeon]